MEAEVEFEDPAADTLESGLDLRAPKKSALDQKMNDLFPGVVVRKDLVKAVKGNAIVPSFVLEYLLGQYAASDDEAAVGSATIRSLPSGFKPRMLLPKLSTSMTTAAVSAVATNPCKSSAQRCAIT